MQQNKHQKPSRRSGRFSQVEVCEVNKRLLPGIVSRELSDVVVELQENGMSVVSLMEQLTCYENGQLTELTKKFHGVSGSQYIKWKIFGKQKKVRWKQSPNAHFMMYVLRIKNEFNI